MRRRATAIVGAHTPRGKSQGYDSFDDWGRAAAAVSLWLHAVKIDHEAPDLWGELAKEKIIAGNADRAEYAKLFSANELKLLRAGLADIERFIEATQPLDPSEKEDVRRRFAYLLDAAERGVRKIDWLNIFIAQIVAMVIAGVLDPKFYGPVMAHAANALNVVFQFGLKLLN